MRLRSKRIGVLASLVFVFVALFATCAYAASLSDIIPKPSRANGYVYDEYHILSDSDIAEINKRNEEIRKDTGGQIAVVIVKDLGGYEIEEYALNCLSNGRLVIKA